MKIVLIILLITNIYCSSHTFNYIGSEPFTPTSSDYHNISIIWILTQITTSDINITCENEASNTIKFCKKIVFETGTVNKYSKNVELEFLSLNENGIITNKHYVAWDYNVNIDTANPNLIRIENIKIKYFKCFKYARKFYLELNAQKKIMIDLNGTVHDENPTPAQINLSFSKYFTGVGLK